MTIAAELGATADALASTLAHRSLALNGEMDVVVSGGGNYDAYYMGVRMVLERAASSNSSNFTLMRRAGASAGGMMPFEVAKRDTDTHIYN